MTGRIPENILEDILSRVDIVEVISSYMPLKRAGRNFKTCCPFHHEKTPSFMVSPDKQIYHCFGCGESGNAFKFLMRYERMEFPEAAEALARKAGVVLPKAANEDPKATSLAAELYKINELTVSFYANNLQSAAAGKAKSYLLKRGLNDETIKTFKLGLAFDRWDGLINHLRAKNISLSLIEKAGLILPKDGGGYYDRFRNRIIFPIFDVKGRTLGFGARVLDDTLPKYINSPETPVYVKGRHLYGLNFAKDAIRDADSVVIVEGYLDFIMPYQAGIKNIVASLGTALTEEQARFLKRHTHNVVMIYDGDVAGQLATLRSLDIFIEEGMSVKIVTLPAGLDPDSFVREFGQEALSEKIKNAEGLFEYKLKNLKSRYDWRQADGKVKISSAMLETINKIKNAVLKSEYIKMLAQQLDVSEAALWQEESKVKVANKRTEPSASPIKRELKINPTEKMLIKLMLEEAQLVHRIREHLEPSDFQDERVVKIVSAMFDLAQEGRHIGPHILMNHLDTDDISQVICETSFSPIDSSFEHKEKVVDDCVRRIKVENLKLKRQRLHNEIKTAQDSGDEVQLNRLIQEFHSLIKKEVKA